MNKFICTVLIAFAATICARADFASPDFAFPNTVISDAESVLKSASGQQRLSAVMQIVTAKISVNPDSALTQPTFIAHQASLEKEADIQGLMILYEAKTVADYYNRIRWQIRNRHTPDGPLPADMSEWSPEQFSTRIAALCDSAISLMKPYFNRPLREYSEIISIPAESADFYPDLASFAYCRAIDMNRSDDGRYKADALARCTPGTPQWALWTCYANPDADTLAQLYNKYPQGITGGYLLYKLIDSTSNPRYLWENAPVTARRNIDMLRTYLASNSDNVATPSLKSMLEAYTAPRATINFPTCVAPAHDIHIVINYGFTPGLTVSIYKVGISSTDLSKTYSKTLTFDKSVDCGTDTLSLTLPAGNYYVCTSAKPENAARVSCNLTVTPWLPVISTSGSNNIITLADYNTGMPVADTGITITPSRGGSARSIGKTDHDGFLDISLQSQNSYNSYYINVKDTEGRTIYFDNMLSSSSNNRSNDKSFARGGIFVDRPAYHPGDTVQWSAVAVEHQPAQKRSMLLVGKSVSIKFFDANYTQIASGEFITDNYGRASGSFAIPQDLLMGNFRITMSYDNRDIAGTSLMVSDFTPPVFELQNLNVERTGDIYRITGDAMRYSGAPEPGVRVSANIRSSRYFYFRTDNIADTDLTLEGTTGPDGRFAIEFPADTIANGNYDCNITATNISADIATGSTRFRAGKPYYLTDGYYNSGDDTHRLNIDTPVSVPVAAFDTHLQPATVAARWQLCSPTDDDKVLYSDTTTIATAMNVDWANIPAGEYQLRIVPVDTALFDSIDAGEVVLYSVDRNQLPAQIPFILPATDFSYEPGAATVPVTAGVHNGGYIYVTAFGKDGKPYRHAFACKPGFNTLNLPVTPDLDTKINVFHVYNGNTYTSEISLTELKPSRNLTLKGESWRDYVTPGKSESWTLRLSDADGKPVGGAMVATMYNHAIDALASLSWPSLGNIFNTTVFKNYLYTNFVSNVTRSASIGKYMQFRNFNITPPTFMYANDGFSNRVMVRGSMKMAATTGAVNGAAEVTDLAFSNEVAGMAYGVSAAPEAAEEEAAAEDAGSGAAPVDDNDDTFDFRAAETLQAFWMPQLIIDNDGLASIRFDVPNAIGAWNFHAAAWTTDCRTAQMSATLSASKPVMVQPNLPRFLRRGDQARVLATVINNSDTTLTVSTVVEIFDPADNSVITSETFSNTLSPKAQAIIPVTVSCPAALSAVGYRVRSSADGFTDGEQSLIPILEASTTAIDSELFYLTDSDSTFIATIPAATDSNGIVALQYCQNPVWDVIKTLPGLYDNTPQSALAAAASAYAAYTSRGLYTSFPEIRRALDMWQSQAADSALVSKLFKNEDLKLALLAQTPFVGSANANSEQMQRLALTFDSKTIDRTAAAAVAKLENLQNTDGGFAWGDWMRESSHWITECVLTYIGRLNNLGYFPADNTRLARIIDRAFAYLDTHVDNDDAAYAYIYSQYPSRKPSTLKGRQALAKAQQQAIASWKKYSTTDKARAAMMLHNLGNTAVAADIMRSVAQFAVPDAKQGTSFPSVSSVDSYATLLEAFGTVNPQSPVIDGMKQWLTLRTQVTDDLGSWNPLSVAAAYLATGSRWTQLPSTSTANATVDGTPLAISRVEALTGTWTLRLPTADTDRCVTFTRPAGAPVSYGSVISIANRPLDKVNAASSRYLSIDKRYLVERDGKWVQTTDFTLGQRVQVQLIIKADRDMQYITIYDDRPASFEPLDQMPGWVRSGDLGAYRQNSDTRTALFVNYLPKGTYYLTYDMTASLAGTFASGTATIQSQYAPEFTARSSASRITVTD